MKKFRLPTILAALFAGLFLLCACNDQTKDPGKESGTVLTETEVSSDKTETTGNTETELTTGINEAVTAVPRYDYFGADVSKDVTIDASVYTDMQLKLPASLLVTDEDVQDFIESLRFKWRTADNEEAKVKDQPLKMGDTAYIYYRGTIDGVEFAYGSNMEDESPYGLGLGSGAFIPGFEEGLVGVVPAQTSLESPFALTVTFPEDFGDEELNGKEAVFYVVVEYSVQYTLPEYNRSFVEETLLYEPKEDFYASDKALLQEFENYVKQSLESEQEQNVNYAKMDALWTYLTDHAECRNLPQDEITFYYDSYVSEIEYYYSSYSSYYGEQFTSVYPEIGPFAIWYMGMDKNADWQAELRKMSELMVRKDMITHAIGEAEGIESVTDEEYQAQVDYWVEQYSGYMSADEIIQNMGELYLRESAFAVKMGDWLMERATFTYEEK